jgi:hypothetical protein
MFACLCPRMCPFVSPAVPDLEIALSAFKSDADLCCCLANAYLQYKHGAERRAQVCACLLTPTCIDTTRPPRLVATLSC